MLMRAFKKHSPIYSSYLNFSTQTMRRIENFQRVCLHHKKKIVLLHSQTGIGYSLTTETDLTPTADFILIENKIWQVRNSSYLCTPNHKQGLQTARKELAT